MRRAMALGCARTSVCDSVGGGPVGDLRQILTTTSLSAVGQQRLPRPDILRRGRGYPLDTSSDVVARCR